jgi:transcriptional regulator with XRE-family HTH domain
VSIVVPPPSLKQLLGRHLKHLREAKEMTQAELSDASGISERYIRNLERGDRWPQAAIVTKLCKGLETTIRDLYDFDYP